MLFKLSEKEMKREKRPFYFISAFLVFIGIAGITGIFSSENMNRTIFFTIPAAIIFLSALYLIKRDYQKVITVMKEHKLEIKDERLILHSSDMKNEISFVNVKSVRIHTKKSKVDTILIVLKSGFKFKLRGYEKMDILAELIEKQVPSSIIVKK